jgi:hypothetical protein
MLASVFAAMEARASVEVSGLVGCGLWWVRIVSSVSSMVLYSRASPA